MLRKAAATRYVSNVIGTGFTIANLFVITYLLDIYQFALWGVANSLIYIFSTIGQLTYVQYIEKYFPNYSLEKMNYYLYKFLKTIFFLTIFWLLSLYGLQAVGYFEKFNADNMFILFTIISALTFIESSIELSSKYLLALKKTEKYDLNELLIFKFLRLVIFYILLTNGFSVYYLLLTNLILRSLLLIRVLNFESKGIFFILKSIFKSNIKVDNFENLSYTSLAFIIKSFKVTFLNVLFFILTIYADNETIANYSLGILIINNLRPIFSSLSGLLTPIISTNIAKQKNSSALFSLVNYLNKLTIGIVTLLTIYITEYQFLIEYFLESFDDNVYKIILISVFASSITSLYTPKFLDILFSNNEKKLLRLVGLNYFFCIGLYYTFEYFYNVNIFYIYILFELTNLFLFSALYKGEKLSNHFSYSFLFIISYLGFYVYSSQLNSLILFLCLGSIIFDGIKFIRIFNKYVKIKNINYET